MYENICVYMYLHMCIYVYIYIYKKDIGYIYMDKNM